MVATINLSDSKRAAFTRGFWKGLAAPLMLYSSFELPPEAIAHEFRELPRRAANQTSDWIRVGDALRKAAEEDKRSGG